MSDTTLQNGEGLILVMVIVAFVLRFSIRRLQGRRPEFRIGWAIFVAFALRFLASVAVSATGLGAQLRGGDETTYLGWADTLAKTPLGRGFLPHGTYQLHTVLFALQIKLDDLSMTALRVTQIGIALLGLTLILAAVHDLAGARASRLAAWVLVFEPASIFFNAGIDKEPLMLLATGMVVFGGTKMWQHLEPGGGLLCALGGLIAVETRSYAGWFLVSAAVLILLHAALRRLDTPVRSVPIVYAIIIAGFLVTPTVIAVTSKKSLQTLQSSQNYTTGAQAVANQGAANSDNLALEQVDFSSRSAVVTNLPTRIFDVIFKPFPWQLQNASQQLGAVGSLIALGTLFLLIRYAWLRRRHLLADVAPIIYTLLFLTIAYALAAGNAGTGFRYRTHLVVLAIAAVAVLRESWLRERAKEQAADLAGLRPSREHAALDSGLAPA